MRPRPQAWSLARSRSRGARLPPSGRLLAPRPKASESSVLNFRIARSLPRGPREEPCDAGARSDRAPARGARATCGAPARGSPKGPRPRAWSLARSRSRGARLLPSGRLLAPRAEQDTDNVVPSAVAVPLAELALAVWLFSGRKLAAAAIVSALMHGLYAAWSAAAVLR